MRLQPNCSELVFWLDELDEMDVDPIEILLAAADEFPLLKNEDSKDELEFWVFSTMEEKERAAQILAQTGSWEEFWDQLCKRKNTCRSTVAPGSPSHLLPSALATLGLSRHQVAGRETRRRSAVL